MNTGFQEKIRDIYQKKLDVVERGTPPIFKNKEKHDLECVTRNLQSVKQ